LIFPMDYREVGTTREVRREDPIYFSTRYIIVLEEEPSIYAVDPAEETGFLRASRSNKLLAAPGEVIYNPFPVDTRDRAALIEWASRFCGEEVKAVVFRGVDEHLTFVYEPDLKAITDVEILDVVPPEPSWLVQTIDGLKASGMIGDLAMRFSSRVLDLSQYWGDDVYYPCTASGLGKSLDSDRVDVEDPLIVGCEISREVFRAAYPGKNHRFINTCPVSHPDLRPKGPFVTRCCRSERRGLTRIDGHTGVLVHWGDGAPQIYEAIRCLKEELDRELPS